MAQATFANPWHDEIGRFAPKGTGTRHPLADQMGEWEQSKPWNLTKEQAVAQSVPGFWHKNARETETASWDGKYIRTTDEFYALPEETRRAIAYHEAGHAMLEAAGGLTTIEDPLSLIDKPGGQALSYNAEEILAEGYSVLWSEPEWFDRMNAQEIRDVVIDTARRAGFPLPDEAVTPGVYNVDAWKKPPLTGPGVRSQADRPNTATSADSTTTTTRGITSATTNRNPSTTRVPGSPGSRSACESNAKASFANPWHDEIGRFAPKGTGSRYPFGDPPDIDGLVKYKSGENTAYGDPNRTGPGNRWVELLDDEAVLFGHDQPAHIDGPEPEGREISAAPHDGTPQGITDAVNILFDRPPKVDELRKRPLAWKETKPGVHFAEHWDGWRAAYDRDAMTMSPEQETRFQELFGDSKFGWQRHVNNYMVKDMGKVLSGTARTLEQAKAKAAAAGQKAIDDAVAKNDERDRRLRDEGRLTIARFANPWHDEIGRFAPKGTGSRFPKGYGTDRPVTTAVFDPRGNTYTVTAADGTKIEMSGDGVDELTDEQRSEALNAVADCYDLAPLDGPPPRIVVHSDPDVSEGVFAWVKANHPNVINLVGANADWEAPYETHHGMPSERDVSKIRFTASHEYGHSYLYMNEMNGEFPTVLSTFSKREVRDTLSEYGRTSPIEAHAEAFAEYFGTAGTTKNAAALRFAADLGWRDELPKGIAAAGPRPNEIPIAIYETRDGPIYEYADGTIVKADEHIVASAAFANPWHDEVGKFAPKGTGKRSSGRVSKAEERAAKAKAKAKAKQVPQPTEQDVIQGQVDALLAREGLVRPGGDRRGNNTARKQRAKKLAAEFGDGETCPCVDCGQRLAADTQTAKRLGLDTITQDKILVGTEGGSYKLENLVPACAPCNQSRGDREGVGVVGDIDPSWGDPRRYVNQVVRENGEVIAERFQTRRNQILKRRGVSLLEHLEGNPDALPADFDDLNRSVGSLSLLDRGFIDGDAVHHELGVRDPVRVDRPRRQRPLDRLDRDRLVHQLRRVPPESLRSDPGAIGNGHARKGSFANPWHDEVGRFAPKGTGRRVKTEGDWSPEHEAAAQTALDTIMQHFPNAPEVTMKRSPDITAMANKSKDSIYLNDELWFDDERFEQWSQELKPYVIRSDREAVIVHEYVHVLDTMMPDRDEAAWREMFDYVNEPVTYEVGGKSVTVPRWSIGHNGDRVNPLKAPSVYATESKYEWIAEAVSDVIYNGDDANPQSRPVYDIMKRVYG